MLLFKLAPFITTFFISSPIWATDTSNEGQPVIVSLSSKKVETPALFRIKSSTTQSAYLLGTFHSLPLTAFSQHTQEFLLNHDILVVEGTDHLDPKLLPSELLQYKNENQNKIDSTQNLLDDDLRKRIQSCYDTLKSNYDKTHKIDLKRITAFGIWMLAESEESLHGMDYALVESYTSQSRTILGLELSNESAITEHADEIALQSTEEGRKKLIESAKSTFEMIDNQQILWDAEDEQYLTNKLIDDKSLKDRNLKWIPKIKEISDSHSDQSILFCVGADHILGLYDLLVKDGFTFEQHNPDTNRYDSFAK